MFTLRSRCENVPIRRLFLSLVGFLLLSSSTLFAQEPAVADYTALGDPSYSARLKLSDQQNAEVKKILDGRRQALIAAAADQRAGIIATTNERLAELLSVAQRSQFTELVAGNKLRFTFRDEPWPDVLSWFAGQAGLALVMNEAPAGVFNYSDTKNHTPSEAIDLLNGVLQSKGFTLVRRDKMLIVSPTADGVAYDQVPKVAPGDLASRGRFEFVSVVFPLEGRPVESVLTEVSAFLGTNGRATPLPATGQLMVVDTAGRVEDIRRQIESIPKPSPKKQQPKKKEPPKKTQKKPPPPPPVFQVHSSAGLDLGPTVETLKKLYGDTLPITGDGRVEQISVYAPAGQQESIGKTLQQLKANVTGESQPRLVTYTVASDDLEQLKTLLVQSVGGVQVSSDEASKRLFVVGTAAQHSRVTETLKTLDAVGEASKESVAVYDVRPELVEQVLQLVKPLIPRASVVANGNRVAVRGTALDLQIAKSAIEQLDAAELNEEKPSLRFITLQKKIDQKFLDSVKQVAPQARVTNVPGRNQLAVVATEADHQLLVQAIEQVESELGDAAQPEMQSYPIAVEDPSRLLAMLKKEFGDVRMVLNEERDALLVWATPVVLPDVQKRLDEIVAVLPAKRDPVWKSYSGELMELSDMQTLLKPIVRNGQLKAEPKRNRMMIWATPQEHQKIANTLAAFAGQNDDAQFEDVLLSYPINRGDVAKVVTMLQGLRPNIKFSADEVANRVLVTAPLSEQAKIKGIIEQLDTPAGEQTGDFAKTYRVESVAPSTVIQLLQRTLPNMRMTAEQRSIAAVGSSRDHKRLGDAIQQFDQNPDKKTVKAYPVGQASAGQVSSILQQLIPNVWVAANEQNRTVVVWASESDHRKAQQAVDQFTKEGTSQRTTEIYRFDRTSSTSAERIFERLAPRARVSRVYGTNSVVATATPEEHAMFRDVIAKMTGDDGETVTRVYAVDKKRLNIDDVLASIDDSLQARLSIRMNEQMNSLIVRGVENDQAQLKELIDELTAKIPSKEKVTAKLYPLKHADPDNTRYLLSGLFPEARLTADDDAGAILATALPDDHAEIANVIAQVDVPGSRDQVRTEVYRFPSGAGRAAEYAFERVARRARVVYLPRNGTVVATATAEEHETFQQIAEKMAGDSDDQVTKVYALDRKQIDADDMIDSIDQSLLSRMNFRVNEQTNSLIARGTAKDQQLLKQWVDEILAQVPAAPERVAKIYRFENTDSDAARYILRDLFDDVRVTSDDDTGTLAVTALAEQHEQIANVVKQMDVPGQRSRQSTEIYRFDRSSGRDAANAFERIAPRARISFIDGANSVIATATSAEHTLLKEAADKMNGGAAGTSVTKVYALDKEQIDVEDVYESIDDSLMSRLAIRLNEQTNSLIVRGSERDQETMKGLVDELLAQVPPKKKRVVKVYPFKFGKSRLARYAVRDLFDDAEVTYDTDNNTLIASATEEEHKAIGSLVEQMDTPGVGGKSTKVYRVDTASAGQVYPAISDLVDDGRVSYDSDANVLIVTTNATKHDEVRQVLEDLNRVPGANVSTQVYALKPANPSNIPGSLERLMPQVRVASDGASGSLIVAANEADHVRVAKLVEQLDTAPGQESRMTAYPVKSENSRQIFDSLSRTFAGNGNFSLSFQEPTNTIFLVATPKNHQIFADLMMQLDTPALADATRSAKTYALTNLSGNSARAAITGLLQGTSPPPTIEIDEFGNSLILVGSNEQHERVAATLGQLAGEDSELEIFDLEYVEPWTVESAVDTLFENQPASAAPTMTSDFFSSRLYVRGNKKQIDQIRNLLIKMGETSLASRDERAGQGGGGDVRTIPFKGDVNEAVQQIKSIWPRMRKNRIEIVAPADPMLQINEAAEPTTDSNSNRELLPQAVGEEDNSVALPVGGTKYVAVQTTTRAPAQTDQQSGASQSSDGDESQVDVVDSNDDVKSLGDDAIGSPVVIVPEEDQITIASTDHEALDQLEDLLRAISRSSEDESSSYGSDFAVFLLRNTGASEMRQLLGDLFEQLRKNDSASSGFGGRDGRPGPPAGMGGFGGYGSLFGPTFGNVAVVADDRLNALIIHGDRKERELIKELLRVLDTKELANPIVVHQPELIRLENTQADRVLGILENVYRSQLQSGGGRRKVEIPEGVSPEVASVLQQINAAAGAPVLTLDVDNTTNSIVMRAPPELRQEIKTFVSSLDSGAGKNRSRNVRVIRLQRGKSDQMRDALQEFILERTKRN